MYCASWHALILCKSWAGRERGRKGHEGKINNIQDVVPPRCLWAPEMGRCSAVSCPPRDVFCFPLACVSPEEGLWLGGLCRLGMHHTLWEEEDGSGPFSSILAACWDACPGMHIPALHSATQPCVGKNFGTPSLVTPSHLLPTSRGNPCIPPLRIIAARVPAAGQGRRARVP